MTAWHAAPTVTIVSLADLRTDCSHAGLGEKDLAKNPFRQFEKWFQEAEAAKITEPNAMTLATTGRDGRPAAGATAWAGAGFAFFAAIGQGASRSTTQSPPVSRR